jgi:4-carboxymuconolactone decarboxylase
MEEKKDHSRQALAVRREVLGAAYVDSRVASTDPADQAFQKFVVDHCWGTVWTDPRLSRRERSLATLCLTVALGRMDEFALHVRGAYNNGVTTDELEALVIQIGVYAGVPASLSARRAVAAVTAEMAEDAG